MEYSPIRKIARLCNLLGCDGWMRAFLSESERGWFFYLTFTLVNLQSFGVLFVRAKASWSGQIVWNKKNQKRKHQSINQSTT